MKHDRSKVLLPAALGALGMVAAWAVLTDEGTRAIPQLVEPEPSPAATPPAAVAIDVTDDAVRVHGTALPRSHRFALTGGRVEPADLEGHLVKPLRDALAQADLADPIAITAVDATPWPTLLDLLYTAGRAGARRYAFVTAEGTIAIEPPRFDPRGRVDGPPFVLELAWRADAVVATRRAAERVGLAEPPGTTCRLVDRTPSSAGRATLRSIREAACRTSPTGVRFVLSPAPDASYRELVDVAGALESGASCSVVFTITSGEERPSEAAACTAEQLGALMAAPS